MIPKRKTLKISTMILLTMLLLITAGLFATNLVLKEKFNKLDQNDKYWDFKPLLAKPFKYIKVNGNNIGHIYFEQASTASVKVSEYWKGYPAVKAFVKDDTLHLTISGSKGKNEDQYNYMMVRVFAPQLLSVDATDTDIRLSALKQNNLSVNLNGKSTLNVESFNPNFDTFNITQRDSSETTFAMSPDLKGAGPISFRHIKADLYNSTSLNLVKGYAEDLKLHMGDSCFVTLSGKTLGKLNK